MNYKNLLAIHCVSNSVETLESAISIAQQYDAHLEILVLNLALPIPTTAFVQNPAYDWSNSFLEVFGESKERVKVVKEWLEKKGIKFHVSAVCQQMGLINNDIAVPALYADLVLYHKGTESFVKGMLAKALEGSVLNAEKPALLLNNGINGKNLEFKKISIAWNPVPGAMKAVTAAVPMLNESTDVEVLVVSNNNSIEDHEANTRKFSDWLSRHSIESSLTVIEQGNTSVSDALVKYMNDSDRDLFILGAYGHSRFTERLFSGVSYEVLKDSNKSLFIAH